MKKEAINIAPSSSHGHFIKGAKNVVNLDEINETFLIEGAAILETNNHTTLEIEKSCLITCQVVYNPLEKMYTKSQD